jgi:ABC-type molybdate transport system substrate-binding protein
MFRWTKSNQDTESLMRKSLVKYTALLFTVLLLLTSCKSAEKIIVKSDTIFTEKIHHDTIRINENHIERDSFVMLQGKDTTYIYHRSILLSKADTVYKVIDKDTTAAIHNKSTREKITKKNANVYKYLFIICLISVLLISFSRFFIRFKKLIP